jgi:hypothetical protein
MMFHHSLTALVAIVAAACIAASDAAADADTDVSWNQHGVNVPSTRQQRRRWLQFLPPENSTVTQGNAAATTTAPFASATTTITQVPTTSATLAPTTATQATESPSQEVPQQLGGYKPYPLGTDVWWKFDGEW